MCSKFGKSCQFTAANQAADDKYRNFCIQYLGVSTPYIHERFHWHLRDTRTNPQITVHNIVI